MKIKTGVLRGGKSSEYNVSLMTGATVLNHIPKDRFEAEDIFIDKNGIWHLSGLPVSPSNILKRYDVIFNALHGEFGEDGEVQKILESFGVPFTGSNSLGCTIGMNKILSKKFFSEKGIKVPMYVILNKDEESVDDFAYRIFRSFPMPYIVKPISLGSSVGIYFADSYKKLRDAIDLVFQIDDKVMIEEYIGGREATCGVIEGYRGHELYALPPVEIRLSSKDKKIFDYEEKYSGKATEICPATFHESVKNELENLAKLAHQAVGLSHYSRSDFMIHPRRGIYILEINSLPGLTEHSLLPKSLKAVGAELSHFIEHVLDLALSKKRG